MFSFIFSTQLVGSQRSTGVRDRDSERGKTHRKNKKQELTGETKVCFFFCFFHVLWHTFTSALPARFQCFSLFSNLNLVSNLRKMNLKF